MPCSSDADRRDHRDEVALVEQLDDLRVDAHDLAHLADVDASSSGRPCSTILSLRARMQSAVAPVRPTALPPAWLIRPTMSCCTSPASTHLDHFHGLGVGDAHALDELALLAQRLQRGLDLRPAAVHHHRVHADQLEQHHVLGEVRLQLGIGHGVAAVLDDDGLAVELADVGQRLGQDLGLLGGRELGGHLGGIDGRVAGRSNAIMGQNPAGPMVRFRRNRGPPPRLQR